MLDYLNIFTDGGARGNPGPAATGVFITDRQGKKVTGFGKKIGRATNNVAEYKAVISALDWIVKNKSNLADNVQIYFNMDSNLVYSQLSGFFKIKNAELRNLFFMIKQKEAEIKIPIHYSYVRREKNIQADKYVNQALDTEE